MCAKSIADLMREARIQKAGKAQDVPETHGTQPPVPQMHEPQPEEKLTKKKRGRPALTGARMSATEYQKRWRAKKAGKAE